MANRLKRRLKEARFPVLKTLEKTDLTRWPSLDRREIRELAEGDWIKQHENLVLLGRHGTGKTHAAIALGVEACRRGYRVLFSTAAQLVNQLVEAREERTLERLQRRLGPLCASDRRRTRLHPVFPGRGAAPVPGLRQPLRAVLSASDLEPGFRGVDPGVCGCPADGRVAGPFDASLPHSPVRLGESPAGRELETAAEEAEPNRRAWPPDLPVSVGKETHPEEGR